MQEGVSKATTESFVSSSTITYNYPKFCFFIGDLRTITQNFQNLNRGGANYDTPCLVL